MILAALQGTDPHQRKGVSLVGAGTEAQNKMASPKGVVLNAGDQDGLNGGSASGAQTPALTELQPALLRLRRSLAADSDTASFGSIRFPGRVMPAKYVGVSSDSRADVLVNLLVDTWKLESPCAVFALNPSATKMADDPAISPRLDLDPASWAG